MTLFSLVIISFSLFCIEILYFKIANHFNIIDKPNQRSSHTQITLRGGGIIFILSAIVFFLFFGFQYPYFIVGLILISGISFLDDVVTLNNKVRLSIHLVSVILMLYQLDLFQLHWYWIVISLIFAIGTINAYNFMDGINGLTGAYSFLVIVTLYAINNCIVQFTSNDFLIITGLSLLVFNIFNFRKNAKCFAGDVGSIGIAFIILFFIGQLILKTQNLNYILLLLVYGLDSVVTITFRKIRGENIFEAHRTHYYQYLVNVKGWTHLEVSGLYCIIQFAINAFLIIMIKDLLFSGFILVLITGFMFVVIRFLSEGKSMLLG